MNRKFGSASFIPEPGNVSLGVIGEVQKSVNLGPGWHTAAVCFQLDEAGKITAVDEYKVCSWGPDKPNL